MAAVQKKVNEICEAIEMIQNTVSTAERVNRLLEFLVCVASVLVDFAGVKDPVVVEAVGYEKDDSIVRDVWAEWSPKLEEVSGLIQVARKDKRLSKMVVARCGKAVLQPNWLETVHVSFLTITAALEVIKKTRDRVYHAIPQEIMNKRELLEGLKWATSTASEFWTGRQEVLQGLPVEIFIGVILLSPDAYNDAGVFREKEGNPVAATPWYDYAAKKGNKQAMFNLGRHYETGLWGVEKNVDEALRLYRLAAAP